MVEAVEDFHKAGYLHRGIKPDDIRIINNKVVLIDFGLSSLYIENNVHKPRDSLG